MGSNLPDQGLDIALGDLGEVYVTGIFEGTVDFDPGANVANMSSATVDPIDGGLSDIFLLKLDADGNYVWSRSFGGIETDYSQAIVFTSPDTVFIGGHFRETVDFDPSEGTLNKVSTGGYDIFVAKLALRIPATPSGSLKFYILLSLSIILVGSLSLTRYRLK